MTDFRPQLLPPSVGGLAGRVPAAPPGSIFVLAARGGFAAPPQASFEVVFGRKEPDVHVCIGADDPRVSRLQGRLVCTGTEWWLRNEGKLPIRLPQSRFLLTGNEIPLGEGYSPLFIRTSERREHLLEVRVVGAGRGDALAGADDQTATAAADSWRIDGTERIVLTALAARYLRQEPHPQPQSWKQVKEDLNSSNVTHSDWTEKKAANVVLKVRERLQPYVAGLRLEDWGDPAGNMVNHQLVQELLQTATLRPPDLRLLDAD
ncbi:FHA domain-containing protein [Actinophytocola sp.]|uniref:FHA domain-containing protein n=1 Tax=Actinophytocola sp. TaxID=1872138 RepID=UPI002ECFEE70